MRSLFLFNFLAKAVAWKQTKKSPRRRCLNQSSFRKILKSRVITENQELLYVAYTAQITIDETEDTLKHFIQLSV